METGIFTFMVIISKVFNFDMAKIVKIKIRFNDNLAIWTTL